MKVKLLNLLSVFLIGLVLISPALIFWQVWQYHIDYVNVQRVAFLEYDTIPQPVTLSTTSYAKFASLLRSAISPSTVGFIASSLLGFCSGRMLNTYYQARQDTLFKQKVASLEKVWQRSIY
jgi:hypothetical protein